jgi:hypothetical protein
VSSSFDFELEHGPQFEGKSIQKLTLFLRPWNAKSTKNRNPSKLEIKKCQKVGSDFDATSQNVYAGISSHSTPKVNPSVKNIKQFIGE